MNTIARTTVMALCLALPACSSINEVAGQKHMDQLESRTYELNGFQRIDIEADSRLHITQGDEYKVVLYTEPHHFPKIDILVDDGTLKIEHKGRKHRDSHVKLEITAPNYEYIRLDAIVEADIEDLNSENLELIFNSIGDIDIGGQCENLSLRITGIGDFDARQLECKRVDARVSGIGDTKLKATETIKIKVSGIGDVSVYGAPQVKGLKSSGIGNLSFRD